MPPSYNKTVKNFIWLLLLIFLSMGCGSQGTDSADKEGNLSSIKGVVTAASTITFKANPKTFKVAAASGTVTVPGAVCTMEGTDKSATTDANGFFQITDVAAGSYILICKKTASDRKVYAFLEIVDVQDGETIDLGTVDIKKTGGIQGMATLADQTYHTGISVYIPGTSMQARTDATGAYLINDVPEETYELRFEKSGYLTSKITGLPVTEGETVLAEDMTLSLSTGASGIISIENGKVYSSSRTVTVYLTASVNATLYQISEDPIFMDVSWNPISPSKIWTFDSDGEKRLYGKFADANGLESSPISDTIIIDTTPPENGNVSINNGASATNSTTVTLNLSATDATTSVAQMKISNDPDFADADWESFASTRLWTIPAGDGVKTVYVKYRDIVGNETTQTISESIVLDTTLPVNPSISIQEGAYTNHPLVHLNLSALEAAYMNISEDSNFTSTQAITFASKISFSLSAGSGNKTIYAKFIDEAGNETAPVSSSIILDTTSPTTPIIFNQNQTTNQTTFTMTLSTPSTDTNFKTYQLKGGQYPDWTDTAETTVFNFALAQQGANILSIRGKDLAGNTSNAALVTISLDSLSPVLSEIKVSPTITTATITWKTSEPTTGKVDFGLNQDYGSSQVDSIFKNSHTVTLTGLSSNTIYHYRITATDNVGNTTISTDLMFTTLEKIAKVSAGGSHTCAVTTSGKVKCWGRNSDGELGIGEILPYPYNYSTVPVDVVGLSSSITAIAAGSAYTCALTTAGGVKCWGRNDRGQLGNGTTNNTLTPVDVAELTNGVKSIVTGLDHTCAITILGGVKCWGNNTSGQIGDGTTSNRLIPVDVIGLSSGVIFITTGGEHTCAITISGGVKCWGRNNYGQLGDGTTTDRLTPVNIVGLSSGVAALTAGSIHTCAISELGGIKCWGHNGWGQIGDGTIGTENSRLTPVDVSGFSSEAIGVSAGTWHTCALTSAGGVKCWGFNELGSIGDGTVATRITPVDVTGLTSGTTDISTGQYNNCVITNAGGVKCWGQNIFGALGDGTTTNRYTPIDTVGLY